MPRESPQLPDCLVMKRWLLVVLLVPACERDVDTRGLNRCVRLH